MEQEAMDFLEADKVFSLQDIHDKLSETPMPANITVSSTDHEMVFLSIDVDSNGKPSIVFSLTVDSFLQFVMHDSIGNKIKNQLLLTISQLKEKFAQPQTSQTFWHF